MKEIQIEGVVDENPKYENEQSKYKLVSKGKTFEIVSDGLRAKKDAIFLQKGYQLKIKGECENESIFVKEACINIGQIIKNQESD